MSDNYVMGEQVARIDGRAVALSQRPDGKVTVRGVYSDDEPAPDWATETFPHPRRPGFRVAFGQLVRGGIVAVLVALAATCFIMANGSIVLPAVMVA